MAANIVTGATRVPPVPVGSIGARVLPAARAARQPGREASLPGSDANHPPPLLYIDAGPENATQLGRLLAHRPRVQLLWTPLRRQALEQAESRPPTLILLHLELLDIPAGEMLRQIRASPTLPGIPVVRVALESAAAPETGVVQDEAVEKSLTTPYDGERVLSVLDEILSGP